VILIAWLLAEISPRPCGAGYQHSPALSCRRGYIAPSSPRRPRDVLGFHQKLREAAVACVTGPFATNVDFRLGELVEDAEKRATRSSP